MDNSIESLTEVKINSFYSALVHQASHLIVDSYWGQAWFLIPFSQSPTFSWYGWKWFPRLFDPSFSQGLWWGWPACCSPDVLAHLEDCSDTGFFLSPKEPPPNAMTFQRQLKLALQWHQWAPSVLIVASYWVTGVCVCLVRLNVS